jgi:mTERF domain-containing protein, mitochondrial
VAYTIGRDTANAKMELMRSLGLSRSQVAMAVAKFPSVLCNSEERLRRGMDFLTKEAGMDMEAIARSPGMLKLSIEGRLAPRLKVLRRRDCGVAIAASTVRPV